MKKLFLTFVAIMMLSLSSFLPANVQAIGAGGCGTLCLGRCYNENISESDCARNYDSSRSFNIEEPQHPTELYAAAGIFVGVAFIVTMIILVKKMGK